jgi:thiol-disulfide isomerase/thioredoxin
MNSAIRVFAMLGAAVLALSAGAGRPAAAGESGAAWQADLSLPGFSDNTLTAADVDGRPVLLQFWASWCSSCATLLWDLDALSHGFPDAAYYAVSTDDDAAAPRAYLERHPLFEREPQRFYFDASGALQRDLAVDAVPLILLFDATGHELLRHSGHMNAADLQRFRNALEAQTSARSQQ